MKDLYRILGVPKTASAAEIKKAYRKLAKDLHPDRHKDDARTLERFKAVTAAYDILGDAEKRRKYDAGEIDAEGKERAPFGFQHAGPGAGPGAGAGAQHFEFTGSPEDIFQELFGFGRGAGAGPGGGPFRAQQTGQARGRTMRKGGDISYTLNVDFLDAALGSSRRISLESGKTLDVKIPAGVRDGQQIRLAGQGGSGRFGGAPGDALITVRLGAHPYFRRDGDNILLDLPITLDEAVLGAKVQVPTIHGRVSLNIPAGTSSGKTFRLTGKGIHRRGRQKGDQLVTVQIVLPPDKDGALKDAIARWAKDHPYKVRDKLG